MVDSGKTVIYTEHMASKSAKLLGIKQTAADLRKALAAFPDLVDDYLATTGFAPSTFGIQATGTNRNFVRQMHAGRDFQVSTVLRVCEHIDKRIGKPTGLHANRLID